ncbi:hypothetical protein DPMN_169674 [Dreissena polymorpha]|uniref:Uncharacterized protein n=1 Tax=Dreissena polymorpha TaxID=45954 RepID=A0A9D4DWZ8_DREPO|nr:hypothetical protein DPMN_169674 [Dreissena polymorpha]
MEQLSKDVADRHTSAMPVVWEARADGKRYRTLFINCFCCYLTVQQTTIAAGAASRDFRRLNYIFFFETSKDSHI